MRIGVGAGSRTRRIAKGAAYAGGGLGLASGVFAAGLFGVLKGETHLARRRIPQAVDDPPQTNGTLWAAAGVSRARPPITLAMLGDSSAAGYGVHRKRDTPAAKLAIGISAVARRPVRIANMAVVGAESPQLVGQLDALRTALGRSGPDVAVIMIGVNDVTHNVKTAVAVRALGDTVRGLRALGAEVVVGTCPDLGTIRPLAQPLRQVARHLSRRLARAQTIAVVEAGGRTVSLGDLLGPLFSTRHDMFSDDQFHPSAAGYEAAADALLPSVLDALGMHTRSRSASAFTTRLPKRLSRAAAQAASHPGSEVAGTDRRGVRRAAVGVSAQLRRRRRRHGALTAPATELEPAAMADSSQSAPPG